MAVKKKWVKTFGSDVWGFDVRIEGVRVRRFGFSTEATRRAAVSALEPFAAGT